MNNRQAYAAYVAFWSWMINGSRALTRFDTQAALTLYDLHLTRGR